MKRTFHISSGNAAVTANTVLLCELSQYHICLSLADAVSKKITQLSYYELRNLPEPQKLSDVLQAENIDMNTVSRVVVSNACKEIVIVPESYFTEENARRFYTTLHGHKTEMIFFDDVPEYKLVLAHAVPQVIIEILKSSKGTEAMHLLSCQLSCGTDRESGEQITVHFTSKEFYIVAVKEEQLKGAQTYFYTAPLDVVYYLLAICREYGFSQNTTNVTLSGLISEDSAMYKELYQYFSNIHFRKPVSGMLRSEYPHHFFSSMYNLAACVL